MGGPQKAQWTYSPISADAASPLHEKESKKGELNEFQGHFCPQMRASTWWWKIKTIHITGGTTGIVLATAKLLNVEGAKIVVTGRNLETLAAVQRELPDVIVIKSDSGSLSAAQLLGNDVKKHVAHLDGVFLNAGIATASIAIPGESVYCATKAALSSLGKTLAVELAPRGIRVKVVSPGMVSKHPSLINLACPESSKRAIGRCLRPKTLLKRLGTADEVAQLVRFLLSEESSYIIGTELVIDGGLRLAWQKKTAIAPA
jgi:NAD(P)-dependent dehydrogenase (short-subunit alcohol dehydrogenase family)